MKTELKGWLADNTVTTDNKEDKILVLERDRKSTRLNSSHTDSSRMPSSA